MSWQLWKQSNIEAIPRGLEPFPRGLRYLPGGIGVVLTVEAVTWLLVMFEVKCDVFCNGIRSGVRFIGRELIL